MRKAEKLLSILIALGLCLSMNAYARADMTVPVGVGCAAPVRHARAEKTLTASPLPDPEPPADDGTADEDVQETLTVTDGESALLQDERLVVLGNDPLAGSGEGYANGADSSALTAPPWPLGINGGSRAIVLSGQAPALSLVRADVAAGGWGALSASSGSSDASVTAVDAELRVLSASDGGMDSGWRLLGYDGSDYGSGYGAYLAGGASAYFYGSSLSGATYGAVLDGADQVWFGSSHGTVLLYDGASLAGAVRGGDRTSLIDSVFGMMMRSDVGHVTVEDGTAIRTAEAVVLCKDGSGAFTFHNARLCSDSGVLFQMMDSDDDDRIGLLTDTYAFSPVYDEANVGGGPGFPAAERDLAEPDGAKPDEGNALPPAAQAQHVELAYTNGLYSGSIYNGTGYYGQPGDSLALTVGRGAVLDGDVSLTSCAKAIPYSRQAVKALKALDGVKYCFVDDAGAPCEEEQAAYIQFLRYAIGQYYLQGHVENLPYYNGSAAIDVTVAQDGVWAVRDTSIVTSLTVEDGALVYGQVHDNADGSITLLPACEPLEPGIYTSDADTFALGESDGADPAIAEEPPRQAVITVGGQEYALDVYEHDGAAYVRLTDLIALFFGGLQPPGI